MSSLLLSLIAVGFADGLPRSTPEAQGIASSAILAFVKAVPPDTMHSLMIVRHGRVVAEGWWAPYDAKTPHQLYSLSKSFTSTAVGLAISEGKLSLDDEVLKFFPDDAPSSPSANLKAMRVSDLLRMSTGHQAEPSLAGDGVWTKKFLAQPVPNKPGTHFLYNTPATYMLSAIVQKATGQTTLDYLKPRLFGPLGIEDPTWGTSPQGVSLGGYGLSVRTEDIARFGQLYLQKGKWDGKQIVPAEWVEQATARQTSNGSNPKSDWDQGYGYQFWRARHGAYRGDGAFGQYCLVMPDQDAVIAITSGTKDMQSVLNLVWDQLLPAMKAESLPPDEEAHKTLKEALADLKIRPQEGKGSPPDASKKRYVFPANGGKLESIAMEDDGTTIVAKFDGTERRIPCGRGEWKKGRLALGLISEGASAASGGWDGDTFTAKVVFAETPFIVTLSLKYAGDELLFNSESNVGFGPTKPPQLVGKPE